MSRNYPSGGNPFGEEEDTWGAPSRKQIGGGGYSGYGNFEDVDDDDFARPVHQKQKLAQQSMNNQLAGTQRALASIYESERMGIATAEELMQQGEQLDNTEKKLDKINNEMKTTQKHLNSIKSVFGGLKNWWSSGKKNEEPAPEPEEPRSNRSSRLQDAMQNSENTMQGGQHPALRLRSEDAAGFYDDVDDSSFGRPAAGRSSYGGGQSSYGGGQSGSTQTQAVGGHRSAYSEYEANLDSNLDLMSGGMARLKGLALGLGDEVTAQNEQLDRLTRKTDESDAKINYQNQQMRGILGGKKK